MGAEVWDITKNQAYVVLAARVTPLQVTEHEANAKAINALFAGVSRAEFSRVQVFQEAHKVWTCLENYHEGTPQVKARLFETHRREYENFTPVSLEQSGLHLRCALVVVLNTRPNLVGFLKTLDA